MGSILRGVLGKRLAIIDKSANYSVLMHWIFLKHVLGGVNDRGHRLISNLYTSGINLCPLGLRWGLCLILVKISISCDLINFHLSS